MITYVRTHSMILAFLVAPGLSGLLLLQTGCSSMFGQAFAVGAGLDAASAVVGGVQSLAIKGLTGVDKKKTAVNMSADIVTILSKAKSVSVMVDKPENTQVWGTSGGIFNVLRDGASGRLMELGYSVVPPMSDKIAQKPDLNVTCAMSLSLGWKGSGTDSFSGYYSASGDYRESISSASLRIEDTTSNAVILTAIVSYKKPKSPEQVAADFGTIIGNARAGTSAQ